MKAYQVAQVVKKQQQQQKKPPANAGDAKDVGLIPRSGRSPRGGHDNPLQYSCLENPMGRGAWRATVSPWGCTELDMTEHTHLIWDYTLLPCDVSLQEAAYVSLPPHQACLYELMQKF